MTNIRLKLFAYTVVTLLYTIPVVYKSSANTALPAKNIPKKIDKALECNQCCSYGSYIKACDIFYNLCKTNTFHDTTFMFSKKKFRYQEAYDKGLEYVLNNKGKIKIILILVDNNVYFSKQSYENFKKEVESNIKKTILEDAKELQSKLNYTDEAQPNSGISKFIYRNKYDNIYNISRMYIKITQWYNDDLEGKNLKPIKIYNAGHKEECIRKLNSTTTATLKTILLKNSSFVTSYNKNPITTLKPNIVTTVSKNSIAITNNHLFADIFRKPTSYKNLEVGREVSGEPSNSTLIGVTVATAVVIVGAVFLTSIYIYKTCNRDNPEASDELESDNKNTNAESDNKNIKTESDNKNTNVESIEHIYEDPYVLPYNSVQLVIDDNSNYTELSQQSEEHIYTPYITDPSVESSKNTLTDTNNFNSSSSLHEQQDTTIEIENNGETTPIYYTLEDNKIAE
jgi:hypothetical protein